MSEKNTVDPDEESTMETWDDGTKVWYDNMGRFHRLDGPAIEYSNGSKAWWVHDKRHRIDGPAIEWNDGAKFWYVHGVCHRVDGPAVEYADGSKFWYVHDEFIVSLQPKNK